MKHFGCIENSLLFYRTMSHSQFLIEIKFLQKILSNCLMNLTELQMFISITQKSRFLWQKLLNFLHISTKNQIVAQPFFRNRAYKFWEQGSLSPNFKLLHLQPQKILMREEAHKKKSCVDFAKQAHNLVSLCSSNTIIQHIHFLPQTVIKQKKRPKFELNVCTTKFIYDMEFLYIFLYF